MENSNFFLKQEISKFNSEKEMSDTAIEVAKENFIKEIKSGLGDEIKHKIRNKKKIGFFTKIRLRLARWQTIRKCKRYEKRALKEMKERGTYTGLY
jgi:hypothetical protein